jgi:hypothetical protein
MWMYDLAREQSPTLSHLRAFLDLTRAAGFNAIGLYLEHRFAYPSAPWASGEGALTPEVVRTLQSEYPNVQIVPFINLLGHFEGFLYTEEGRRHAEERFTGMQASPTDPALVRLAEALVDDVLSVFSAEIVHIGGDETMQLGAGASKPWVAAYEAAHPGADGKAALFGQHFAPLAARVTRAGRRPGVWGDMFGAHPDALALLPKETIVFDWQYFSGPEESSRPVRDAGFDVVFAPALHTYNATWLALAASERNVSDHARAARDLGVHGVCVTTWEMALLGHYGTLLPALRACGRLLSDPPDADDTPYAETAAAPAFLAAYARESPAHAEWARLMGIELQQAGGMFGFGRRRSGLKCRLLLFSNPFLLWLRDGDDLLGAPGAHAREVAARARAVAPDAATRGVTALLQGALDFVDAAAAAQAAYGDHRPHDAVAALAPAQGVFDTLEAVATETVAEIGGSRADVFRCRRARAHVATVQQRIAAYGDGSLGYLPSFETITHPKFMPHDQGNWWLMNKWGNE